MFSAFRLIKVNRLWVIKASKSQTLQDRHHDAHVAGGQTDGVAQPFFFHSEQFRQRAVHLFERYGMFGIMQMQQRNTVKPKRFQAFFKRGPGPRGIKMIGLWVTVKFG